MSKQLICWVVTLGALLMVINLIDLNHVTKTRQLSTVQQRLSFINPHERLLYRLDQLDRDPVRIDKAIRQHWKTDADFVRYRIKDKVNQTILSTSCYHTSPFVVSTLLGLPIVPHKAFVYFYQPIDQNLVLYANAKLPRSSNATLPVEALRNFIASRPSNESLMFQVDLGELMPEDSSTYSDHHLMINAHNGMISVYHGWQWRFNLLDWMFDDGSYNTRYPMPQEKFFENFEKALTPDNKEEMEIRRRQTAIWTIFGRTKEMNVISSDGGAKQRVKDVVVSDMAETWQVVHMMYWPNEIEDATPSFRPVKD